MIVSRVREVPVQLIRSRSVNSVSSRVGDDTRTRARGEISDASALHYTNPGDDQTILF
jgi:hypothetical protein